MTDTSTKIIIGVLLITLIATGVYITMGDNVRIRVDNDKSTFYVQENNRWVVGGREYNRLFDGTSQMNRYVSGIEVETDIDNVSETVTIKRTTPYWRGPVIVDTYFFDGKVDDVELFPISHTIEIFNGTGYYYRYTVDDLTGVPDKTKLTDVTLLNFGRNMKVELNPDYRWAWIGWPYGGDSVSAQYDIDSDYEVFHVRLFDPAPSTESATINPASPGDDDALEGLCNVSDSDADDVYFEYIWYVDDVVNETGTVVGSAWDISTAPVS